jgi:16S rRNA processing protein RimM
MTESELIAVGRIIRPHGIRGEMKVYPLTTIPNRFIDIGDVLVECPDGETQEHHVQYARYATGYVIVKFDTVDTRDDAEILNGAYISVPRSQVPMLDEGNYYVFDLIGMRVEDEQGAVTGEIIDIETFPANDLLVIRKTDGVTVQVPAVSEFVVTVDIARKRTVIRFPETDENTIYR